VAKRGLLEETTDAMPISIGKSASDKRESEVCEWVLVDFNAAPRRHRSVCRTDRLG
jgi:hypothetical protein